MEAAFDTKCFKGGITCFLSSRLLVFVWIAGFQYLMASHASPSGVKALHVWFTPLVGCARGLLERASQHGPSACTVRLASDTPRTGATSITLAASQGAAFCSLTVRCFRFRCRLTNVNANRCRILTARFFSIAFHPLVCACVDTLEPSVSSLQRGSCSPPFMLLSTIKACFPVSWSRSSC